MVNDVIGSTTTYELRILNRAQGLVDGVVNKHTGVTELEGSQLPIITKGMMELQDLLDRWTPAAQAVEHNEMDSMLNTLEVPQ